MKKLFILCAMGAALSMASCGHGSSESNGIDSLFSKQKQDTLVALDATRAGWAYRSEFSNWKQVDSTLSVDEFIRGFKYAINADTTQAFSMGYDAGNQALMRIISLEQQAGIKVDREMFVTNFINAFRRDSVSVSEMDGVDSRFRALQDELYMAVDAYEVAKIEASDESKENVRRGRQYIDSLSQADPTVRVMASGVALRIDQPGTDRLLQNDDMAMIEIKAYTLNGDSILFSNGIKPIPIRNTSTIPGLAQGLKQVPVGAKATIVVPGQEAFGARGVQRGVYIGPNETLIFKVWPKALVEQVQGSGQSQLE